MKAPEVETIDFETEAIDGHPRHPPVPVGVSIIRPGDRNSKYWAWGHPSGNNCTKAQARKALQECWSSGRPILCHNAKFDLDVAQVHMDLPMPRWELLHDTMFLIFMNDPYGDLGLKPVAEQLLNMKPEERDAIRDWLIENKFIPKNAKKVGHLICKVPGDIVGAYANGDTIRTLKLFKKLYTSIIARGMGTAYDRERRLLPILLRNEGPGIRADVGFLETAWKSSATAFQTCDKWLQRVLKTKDLNVDSDAELVQALIKSGKADEDKFLLTPKGQISADKESLLGAVSDPRVLQVLQYRSKLGTSASTFIGPWLEEATRTGGTVHPSWNQVRQPGSKKFSDGARTGRLSASRFMNAPKEVEEGSGYELPTFIGLPQLPNVRMCLLPDKGHRWGKRDYSQQELRVLGHFEDGLLLDKYNETPDLDIHLFAAKLVTELLGIMVPDEKELKRWRTKMKTIGFGILYGMGLGALAERMDVDVKTAQRLKNAYLAVFPGLKELQDDLKARGQANLPMTTWGGRQYLVEPPKFIESRGRVCTFEYKLFNYLIQGSSADCTKEAIIRYDDVKKNGRFLVTVHDEISISAEPGAMEEEMEILKDVMASVEFDVPMLSDGATGKSWGALKSFKDAEQREWLDKQRTATKRPK
jgi:DNA polymerase I-like protein with 3'-5' exonuclease and polymerase domains